MTTCIDDTSDKGELGSFKNGKRKIRQPSTNSRATRIKTSKQENTQCGRNYSRLTLTHPTKKYSIKVTTHVAPRVVIDDTICGGGEPLFAVILALAKQRHYQFFFRSYFTTVSVGPPPKTCFLANN